MTKKKPFNKYLVIVIIVMMEVTFFFAGSMGNRLYEGIF